MEDERVGVRACGRSGLRGGELRGVGGAALDQRELRVFVVARGHGRGRRGHPVGRPAGSCRRGTRVGRGRGGGGDVIVFGGQQLRHEGDVGDGQAQGLDAREALLVGEGGHLGAEAAVSAGQRKNPD